MTVIVESLDQDGRGIAHVDGKATFIEGALPGERVTYSIYKKKPNYDQGTVTQVFKASAVRVDPKCKHFGVCGGCSMQHLDASAQVAAKQRILEDNLKHIGKVTPGIILRPTYGSAWGYRQRARMSVKFVEKKGGVLVGFHEKRSSFIANMDSCEVLPARISAMITPLRELFLKMSINSRIPQVELAVGEKVDVMVLRILAPLSPEDEVMLKAFADQYHIQFWLQTKGPETAEPYYPMDAPALYYSLPEFNVTMPYRPTEFTQVNSDVNRILVRRVLQMLDPQPGERIADLFCGLGNFTLPIARRGAEVLGVEGSIELVRRAQSNAVYNHISNAAFIQANLFEVTPESMAGMGYFDKMLIDPPRDGAATLVNAISEANPPKRIVYVSCNPSTLARDADVLVNTKGYRLLAAGVVNMFPHTAHVESIALFEQ